MIVTKEYMLNDFGYHIESTDEALDLCITQGEGMEVAGHMLKDNYAELTKMKASDPLIIGGVVNGRFVVGARVAIASICYAHLLTNNICATTFGSVQKTDEHSQNVNPFALARKAYNEGREMLRTICDVKGWKLNKGVGFFEEVI